MARTAKQAAARAGAVAADPSGAAAKKAKLVLLGKIEAYYFAMRKDPPIGLGAGRLDALERHLEYVKQQSAAFDATAGRCLFEFKAPRGPSSSSSGGGGGKSSGGAAGGGSGGGGGAEECVGGGGSGGEVRAAVKKKSLVCELE